MYKKLNSLRALIETVDRLQSPGGCPWDQEQTISSLAQFIVEEGYEVVDAISKNDPKKICEETGDLLQVIVMLCRIAEGEKKFSVAEVAAGVNEKLIRRHPHVFGDVKVSGSGEVLKNWEQIKQTEKKDGEDKSALAGVPEALPALLRAYRTGEKAARVGFQWKDLEGPLEKVEEEFRELKEEIKAPKPDPERLESEFGDLLFALVTLSRHLKTNPEIALRKTTERFIARFRYVEEHLGKPMKEAKLEEMEALWAKAKKTGL